MADAKRKPDPTVTHPVPGFAVTYVKPTVTNPSIEAGDFTYYSGEDFDAQVVHHYDFYGDKLIIGKFCQIASGVRFIMNGANHKMSAVSTFPFYESFGTGLRLIADECEAAGVRYGFICGKLGFTVIFYRTEISGLGRDLDEGQISGTSGTPACVPDVPDDGPVSMAKEAIIKYMAENPKITYNELSVATSLGRKTVQRHIQSLKDAGLLRRVGSERGGHWEIVE
jgi:predicted HTH transcriptional regulator